MSYYDELRGQISSLSLNLGEVEYHAARDSLLQMQKYFDEHLLSAKTYEKKTLNRELHVLNKKIEKKKPKKKFALVKKSGTKSSTIETAVEKKESKIEIEAKKASIPGGSNIDINYETTGSEEDVVIRDFINSKIRISGNCSSIIIENCGKSELIVADCVFGAAMVRKCNDCMFTLCSRQLRIKNCESTTFKIAICSAVALEESQNLKFMNHPEIESKTNQMGERNMKVLIDSKNEINDFEWPDKSTPSPNWTSI